MPPSPFSQVGYRIGQRPHFTSSTLLVFATAGVLLEELRGKGPRALQPYKCVVLDEVHERSVESDLVLTCLREFMREHRTLRLVLMSATADVERCGCCHGHGHGCSCMCLMRCCGASLSAQWLPLQLGTQLHAPCPCLEQPGVRVHSHARAGGRALHCSTYSTNGVLCSTQVEPAHDCRYERYFREILEGHLDRVNIPDFALTLRHLLLTTTGEAYTRFGRLQPPSLLPTCVPCLTE